MIMAEEVNYWKTSKSSPDTWMIRTTRQIETLGGTVIREAFGSERGRSAFMMEFQIGADRYKVVWPVLPSKSDNDRAARVQAATLMYHDIKARCISAKVLGARTAFFSYLLLADGRPIQLLDSSELLITLPKFLLTEGDK